MRNLSTILDLDEIERRLKLLSGLTGVRLSLVHNGRRSAGDDAVLCPVASGGIPTGYAVRAEADGSAGKRAESLAAYAAEDISRTATAENDMASLAQEVADRYEEINFLYDISAAVGALSDVREVCRLIVHRVADVLGAGRCSVMLVDEESQELQVVASVGVPVVEHREVRVPLGQGISGRVAESGRPAIVGRPEDIPADAIGSKELADVHHFVSVPLLAPEREGEDVQVLGVLNVTRKIHGRMFTSSEQKLLESIAAHTATHIRNCRLMEQRKRQQALEHELKLAAAIQSGLFPEEPLTVGDLTVAGCCRLAHNVGGDYYDYWIVRPGTLAVVIADVSGHNIGAALVASAFRSALRAQAALGRGVSRTVASVNEVMFEDLCRLDMFLSLFYLEYDLETGHMDYCRAGHTKPVLLTGERQTLLDTEGPLVGIHRRAFFEQRSTTISSGSTLVLYTDGLIEAGPSEEDMFGQERLTAAVSQRRDMSPEPLAVELIESACRHMDGQEQVDDMTDVILKREGGRR